MAKPTTYFVAVPGWSTPKCPSRPSTRSSTTQVLTPSQPIVINICAVAGRYAPRRPNAARESVIWFTPVREPMMQNAPKSAQPIALPITSTSSVSTRLSPRMTPSAPRIQLIGAILAPAQIQNCCSGVESRSAAGTGSIPWLSNRTSACSAVAIRCHPGVVVCVNAIMRPRPDVFHARPSRIYGTSAAVVLKGGLGDVGGGRFERTDLAIGDDGRIASNSLLQADGLDCARFAAV